MNTQYERHTGKIKFYNAEKGYGFIVPDDGSEDVFLHCKQLDRSGIESPNKDQKISYTLFTSKKTGKTQASDLELVQ